MTDELAAARKAVQRASETVDDASIREQLRSIDEGLMEMTESEGGTTDSGGETPAKTQGDVPHGENLEEVEEKVVGLASRTDEPTRSHLENARDDIDAYRRKYTREWER